MPRRPRAGLEEGGCCLAGVPWAAVSGQYGIPALSISRHAAATSTASICERLGGGMEPTSAYQSSQCCQRLMAMASSKPPLCVAWAAGEAIGRKCRASLPDGRIAALPHCHIALSSYSTQSMRRLCNPNVGAMPPRQAADVGSPGLGGYSSEVGAGIRRRGARTTREIGRAHV